MKVVIVGSNAIWAIENHYVRYLRESGVEVSLFNCTDYFQPGYIVNRLLNRLGIRTFYRKVNHALPEFCRLQKPDIVWVFKGVELFPSTLSRLKEDGYKLVNYNPDHPFIRTAISHGSNDMVIALRLYNAHFCYSENLKEKIVTEYGIRTFLLPFGYEPSTIHGFNVLQSRDILRVCMIGHADKKRASYINVLLDHGLPVDVYGPRWHRFLQESDQCRIFPAVFSDVFWRTLLDYRVQLNVFRPHNEGSHNMRSFEIPSIGGIQLAPYSPEHARFFKEGKEIWLYKSVEEMVDKARMLLDAPAETIVDFRRAAKARSLHEEYNYRHRSLQVIDAFKELLNKA